MLTEAEPPACCAWVRIGRTQPTPGAASQPGRQAYVGVGAVDRVRRMGPVRRGASAEKTSASMNPRRRPVQLHTPRIFRPNSLFGSRSEPATRPAESFTPPLKLSRPLAPTLAQTPSQ